MGTQSSGHAFGRIADEYDRGSSLRRARAVGQFGLDLVHELPRGAPAASGVPAVPEEGALPQMPFRRLQAALAGETLHYLQVASLVGGGEGQAQAEAGGEGELLAHGVVGVYVVVGSAALVSVGEAFPDQVPAVGGGVDPDVLGRLFYRTFQQRL